MTVGWRARIRSSDWMVTSGGLSLVIASWGGGGGPVVRGHPSGAAALAMAELLRPGTFRALVLVEPIVFPPPYFRAEENPMSAAALRRRSSFPSPEAALASFRGAGAFRRLHGG